MPTTRAAIAAAAQKFDEALPAATKTSAFSATAAPIRNSRARALLPAMPKPVRSSRLRQSGPASSARSSRGARTNGVGRTCELGPEEDSGPCVRLHRPRVLGRGRQPHRPSCRHRPTSQAVHASRSCSVATPSATSASSTSWTSRAPGARTSCMQPLGGVLAELLVSPARICSEASWSPWLLEVGRIARRRRPGRTAAGGPARVPHRSAGRPRGARPTRPSSRARRVRGRRPCPPVSTRALARASRASVSRCSLPSGLRLCGIVMLPTVSAVVGSRSSPISGPLQLVDLVADPGQGAADHRQQRAELRDPVPRGEPRDARVGTAPARRRTRRAAPAPRGAKKPKRAHGAAELADQPPRTSLRAGAEDGAEPRRPRTPP